MYMYTVYETYASHKTKITVTRKQDHIYILKNENVDIPDCDHHGNFL